MTVQVAVTVQTAGGLSRATWLHDTHLKLLVAVALGLKTRSEILQ